VDLDPWRQWQALVAQFAASTPAWQTHSSASGSELLDSAARFNIEARKFFETAASASATTAVEAGRKFSDFLREQSTDVQPLWTAALGAGALKGAPPSAMSSPALGPTREHQQRGERMADAWRRAQEAQRRLQRLWSDALREAAAAFAARLNPLEPNALSSEALRKLYDTWIDCAEDAYARAAHGESFGSALADCMNAMSEWRREVQASIEHWAKLLDLPTRSEINTLTQRLVAVEKQLRESAQRAPAMPQPPPPATPRPPPRAVPEPAASKERKTKAAAKRTQRKRRKAKR
jgi:Poly(R)-hydroxyalkanoic acid synthase subunit (PHA_synth_III_E)